VQTDWGVGPFLFNPGGHSAVYVDGREVASTAPFQSRTLSLIPTSSGLTNATGRVRLTSGRHAIRVTARMQSPFAAGLATALSMTARMRSRDPRIQMPPLGSAIPDLEAIVLIEYWIEQDLKNNQETSQ